MWWLIIRLQRYVVVTDLKILCSIKWHQKGCDHTPPVKLSLVCLTEKWHLESILNSCQLAERRRQQSERNSAECGTKSWTCLHPPRACEVSLTVLQGERGAVHRLALGWSSALRVGHRAGVVNAAPEAGAQLQAPHVANHSRRIKGLLWRQGWKQTNVKPKTDHRRHHHMFIICWFYLIIKSDEVLCAHPPFAFGKVFPYLSADWFMDVLAESGVSSNPEKNHAPFRSCKSQFTHTNTALPKLFIFVCVTSWQSSSCCFPVYSDHLFSFCQNIFDWWVEVFCRSSHTVSLSVTFIIISLYETLSMKTISLRYDTCYRCHKPHIYIRMTTCPGPQRPITG